MDENESNPCYITFLNKFLYDAAANLEIEMEYIRRHMVEGDEQQVSGELSRVEEADISGTTSTSTDGRTSTSIDGTTSTSTECRSTVRLQRLLTARLQRRSTVQPKRLPTAGLQRKSTIRPQHRPTARPQRPSTDIADSTLKSIDISSCDPTSDGNREITTEYFLELEEFLELEDGEKLEDLDSSREVTMEDFLKLEEWLDDMDQNSKKKLDDDQHTSRGDLETSPKASIDRQQPDEIDRQQPHIIDQRPPYIIDRQSADRIDLHPPSIIDRHPPDCIGRHPSLEELPGYIVELEQVEERMYMSKASHLAFPKHQRPPIWTEEADGFHKRVKRIRDPVKIVVPCAVFEAEPPIPPDRSMQLPWVEAALIDTNRIPLNDINKPTSIDATTSPSIDTRRVSEQKEFDVCGNLRDGETTTRSDKSGGKKRRNWKKRKRIKDGPQASLIPHFSDGVRKSRVKKKDPRKTSLHEDRRWLCSIDRQSITSIDRSPLNCVKQQSFTSIDRHLTMLVGTHIKVKYTVFPY
uniref:Uncharacterized protein n=1 Tax=Brassica oleracea var. oleracea TaxID=109376 RepID=A0A0D2ZVE8_BRAOL